MAIFRRRRDRTTAAPVASPRAEAARVAAHQPPAWLAASGLEQGPLSAKQDRDRATLAHLGLALGTLGPLAVWLQYRDRGPFTAQEAKEALNFSVLPTALVVLLLCLGGLPVVGPILAILGALVWIAMALYGVMGASHVTKGRPFRYPFNLRLLR